MSILRCRISIIAECWKGSSGGGGSSGKVDYPDYMKILHTNMLCGSLSTAAVDTVGHFDANDCLLQQIETAVATSPYSGEVAYDPDTDIATFVAAIALMGTDLAAVGTWSSYVDVIAAKVDSDYYDETHVTAVTAAHAAVLDDRLQSDVLPRFQSGMRDINAVISSSFVVGQAIIEGFNTREVADFDAKLRLQNYGQRQQLISDGVKDNLHLLQLKLGYREAIAKTTVEAMRIKVVMKGEELDTQLDIDDKDYRWGIDLFQAGANVLGSISGSAVSTQKMPSKSASVLGGAMSGAAAGAMLGAQTGNPYGIAIGAVIGGIGGALMS